MGAAEDQVAGLGPGEFKVSIPDLRQPPYGRAESADDGEGNDLSVKVIPPCVRYRGKALQTEHYHEPVSYTHLFQTTQHGRAEKHRVHKADRRKCESPLCHIRTMHSLSLIHI